MSIRALCAHRRRRSSSARHVRDGGQAVPLVLGVIAVGVVVLLALAPLARAAAERARAQTAADAAALAGAAEGEAAARDVASTNDGELVEWRSVGRDVWVAVVVGDARAVAKATRG